MREALGGDDLFALILMMRQVDRRVVILVEGNEDVGLIDPHLNGKACRSEVGHGKQAVIQASRLAAEQQVADVWVVVDRDFDSEDALRQWSSRVSVSKHYDLHTDVILSCSDAVGRVVSNHAQRDLVAAHFSPRDVEIAALLVEITSPLGTLRLLSKTNSWGLRLSDFPARELVQAHASGTLMEKTCLLAAARSPNSGWTAAELMTELRRELDERALRQQLCNSHDLIATLSALIRRWGGSAGADPLARAIRSAVDCGCFRRLDLYGDLLNWGREIGIDTWTCVV